MNPTGTTKTIREETLTNVPTADLDTVVAEFEAADAKVKIVSQSMGLWTIVATFETVTP